LIEVILNESIQIELAVSSGVEAVEDVANLEGGDFGQSVVWLVTS
jgi:hypothetical protein